MLTELQEFSKNNTKINPKVIEDMSIVAEKIPCNTIVVGALQLMVRISLIVSHSTYWYCMYQVYHDRISITTNGIPFFF